MAVPDLQAQLGRAIEFRDWAASPEYERGLPPAQAIERYATYHEDRSVMRRMLKTAASEILWDLPDRALIYVPAPNLEGLAMTGELAPRRSARTTVRGTRHRSTMTFLGRRLEGAKVFPMRILPSDVTEAPRASGQTTFEFENYARERLLRAHYGDYQLGGDVAMMQFVSDSDRFDIRALGRLAAISDLLDHYIQTGEVMHPGVFLFNAEGSSGAEVHARINSRGGRLLVESANLGPHLLRALLLVATMANPVTGQELENMAINDSIIVENTSDTILQDEGIVTATERSLRDFAREAGVANLDIILENLRRSHEETEGDIDGSSEARP
ncbi:hypothetical protein PM02_16970 [Sulfitobacter mediterraneus]|uniref:Uncharacterized protein n=2 Tax=Sulfitobacter mediterraneus TaxID=83219 RepID=A0A061SRJ6_9RHOB|nr:hypothetical protein PM02_16970 [Sulfitobacter mediterraneus]